MKSQDVTKDRSKDVIQLVKTELELQLELELARQHIRHLESEIEYTNARADAVIQSNQDLRWKIEHDFGTLTDKIAGLINGITSEELIIIRKSGDVSIRTGKSTRQAGNLFKVLKENLPLSSESPMPQAFKIGTVSFAGFGKRIRRPKDNETRTAMAFWQMFRDYFPILIEYEIDSIIEAHTKSQMKFKPKNRVELTRDIVLSNPKIHFKTDSKMGAHNPRGHYYFIYLKDKTKAYFVVVNKIPVPVYIQKRNGKVVLPPK